MPRLPPECQRCPHQMKQEPIPSIRWVGYPAGTSPAEPISVRIYASGDDIGVSTFLPINSGAGIAGAQYNVSFSTPQELWDFFHQLPRETQTALHNQWGWRPPTNKGTTNRRAKPSARPKISISLDDLDL